MQTETTTKHANVYKLWLQGSFPRPVNTSDRSWQVKLPERKPVIEASTNPVFGANPVRGRPNLTDRNLRRLTNQSEKVKPTHWAVINGMEPEDVKKVQNARKRVRRGKNT